MSLENVKVGDWIKVQVTEIDLNRNFPIRCGNSLSFTMNGEYLKHYNKIAFPLEPTERWMMVSNDRVCWQKRKVIAEKNGKFIAWSFVETDKEVLQEILTSPWLYAKEIEEVHPVEVTLEEIAEKFGVNVNQIKIKK